MDDFIAKIEPWHILVLIPIVSATIFAIIKGRGVSIGKWFSITEKQDEHSGQHEALQKQIDSVQSKLEKLNEGFVEEVKPMLTLVLNETSTLRRSYEELQRDYEELANDSRQHIMYDDCTECQANRMRDTNELYHRVKEVEKENKYLSRKINRDDFPHTGTIGVEHDVNFETE